MLCDLYFVNVLTEAQYDFNSDIDLLFKMYSSYEKYFSVLQNCTYLSLIFKSTTSNWKNKYFPWGGFLNGGGGI